MNGGTISGNEAYEGGGVCVNGGTFTMKDGGTISDNTGNGGGVYVHEGTFTMEGGTISGNTAATADTYGGGGVLVGWGLGTFTMKGGTISGNKALCNDGGNGGNGGGVVVRRGTFTKGSGGTIYGAGALGNTAGSGNGHAVYVEAGQKKRNATVKEGETLDSREDGTTGGWD
jgi:hypothetical protein